MPELAAALGEIIDGGQLRNKVLALKNLVVVLVSIMVKVIHSQQELETVVQHPLNKGQPINR